VMIMMMVMVSVVMTVPAMFAHGASLGADWVRVGFRFHC